MPCGASQVVTERPTIFARSTGALPSAIAIVRVSGPRAVHALSALSGRAVPDPRMAVVRPLRHPDSGALLDTALILWFPGPHTATGEDLVELHLHGGRAVVSAVEAALSEIDGLHSAEPGAFTRRAFENGRLDLTQVEGLADLLSAETERQRTAALVLAEGGLRREVERWQARLLQLAARAEAQIDFADEDDVGNGDMGLRRDCGVLADELGAALANPPAERLRDGVRIGIAGPPNAGKSTLLNALVGREAAIASPVAGTTRDVIETPVSLGGMPVVFVDMAGLRATTDDAIEAIGISRAEAAIARSDVLLWLGEPAEAPAGDHVLRIGTKSDLGGARLPTDLNVSAVTGNNMTALIALLVERASLLLPAIGSLALTTVQQAHIRTASTALTGASVQSDDVLRAEDLRAAMRALDRITGAADTEAMLDTLFGRFCIGK
ncbi:tRNA uridine-5-carboxymethylaminomethyl(34) synthesis GTPase MnmE [Sphingomonas sp. SUN039]|uniref:tRNA uridine-5-carboxymethylaminomethyl(34) synthesis GTPase MnmE n=1 Tax=Sphingomonas sp. SUN039 TaxID=2937787 RepID=UPI0021643933|nr:tRNA uridine-5-carboxymethylaminomethyl(34) synthesis GTPase MnmE [Sphingomonas sp. SUN039]UVO55240.1 tRNA uridine-5-carboxymethylaminomethyl(34) synthesis GTPase MnmE [Sphingomonas sp. SUN039]